MYKRKKVSIIQPNFVRKRPYSKSFDTSENKQIEQSSCFVDVRRFGRDNNLTDNSTFFSLVLFLFINRKEDGRGHLNTDKNFVSDLAETFRL